MSNTFYSAMEAYIESKKKENVILHINEDVLNAFNYISDDDYNKEIEKAEKDWDYTPIKSYGEFLNGIPEQYYQKEAEELIWVLLEYSQKLEAYKAIRIRHNNIKEEKNIKRLKISTLKKTYANQANNILDVIGRLDDTEIESVQYRRKQHKTTSPISELKYLLQEYIFVLEGKPSKDNIFKIELNTALANHRPKPPVKNIIEHLQKLAKKYNLKNYTVSLNGIQKHIANAYH